MDRGTGTGQWGDRGVGWGSLVGGCSSCTQRSSSSTVCIRMESMKSYPIPLCTSCILLPSNVYHLTFLFLPSPSILQRGHSLREAVSTKNFQRCPEPGTRTYRAGRQPRRPCCPQVFDGLATDPGDKISTGFFFSVSSLLGRTFPLASGTYGT